eukprot:SAG31_NODE_3536_length_4145_cov_51.000741_3_plen_640_part_00
MVVSVAGVAVSTVDDIACALRKLDSTQARLVDFTFQMPSASACLGQTSGPLGRQKASSSLSDLQPGGGHVGPSSVGQGLGQIMESADEAVPPSHTTGSLQIVQGHGSDDEDAEPPTPHTAELTGIQRQLDALASEMVDVVEKVATAAYGGGALDTGLSVRLEEQEEDFIGMLEAQKDALAAQLASTVARRKSELADCTRFVTIQTKFLTEREKEIFKMQTTAASAEGELAKRQAALAAERESLLASHGDSTAADRQRQSLLMEEVADLDKEIAALEAQLAIKRTTRNSKASELAEVESKIDEALRSTVGPALSKLDAMKADLETETIRCANTQAKIVYERKAMDVSRDAAMDSWSRHVAQINACLMLEDNLQAELSKAERQQSLLADDRKQAAAASAEAEAAARGALTVAENVLKEATAGNSGQAVRAHEKATAELPRLEVEVAQLNARLPELAAEKASLAAAKNFKEAGACKKEIEKLEARLTEATEAIATLTAGAASSAAAAGEGAAALSAAEQVVSAARVDIAVVQYRRGKLRLRRLERRLADAEAGCNSDSGGAFGAFGQLVAAEIAGLTTALSNLSQQYPSLVSLETQCTPADGEEADPAIPELLPTVADIPELPAPMAWLASEDDSSDSKVAD